MSAQSVKYISQFENSRVRDNENENDNENDNDNISLSFFLFKKIQRKIQKKKKKKDKEEDFQIIIKFWSDVIDTMQRCGADSDRLLRLIFFTIDWEGYLFS